ncbi:glycosyltransferase family 4 protein [bacterium]|nr:glycosyltransferase family 4 protein [bacterium]
MPRVVFVSNYFNHHQASFSDAMFNMPDVEYYFIETTVMSDSRKKLGYGIDEKPKYVLSAYESEKTRSYCADLIDKADFVIIGSADDKWLENRHKQGKFVFRYNERFYKNGVPKWKIPLIYVRNYCKFGRFKNEYLLCASAFAAADAALTRTYLGKTYKWGYFPETKLYDLKKLFDKKSRNDKVSILWCGRLIGWKHPDVTIQLAEKLKKNHIDFSLNIIGCGAMENELQSMIQQKDLSDKVKMLGSMKPDEVREYMERSDVFLFTSDFREGWGAVLNESMNSGCAVVASHAIGSVPFLIENWRNGIVYQNGNLEQLYNIVEKLIKSPDLRQQIGRNAYKSMTELWNASIAAERLMVLYNDLRKKSFCDQFETGPCSRAEIIKNGWFRG